MGNWKTWQLEAVTVLWFAACATVTIWVVIVEPDPVTALAVLVVWAAWTYVRSIIQELREIDRLVGEDVRPAHE